MGFDNSKYNIERQWERAVYGGIDRYVLEVMEQEGCRYDYDIIYNCDSIGTYISRET